jgi:hypothetical protein
VIDLDIEMQLENYRGLGHVWHHEIRKRKCGEGLEAL